MKIAVFCSACDNIDNSYFTLAEDLGTWIGHQGHTLVYGGCANGLMGSIAAATHKAGGNIIGVVPQIIESNGTTSPYNKIHIPCVNLSDRKDIIMEHSDVFVALPGGIGTIDEIFTVASNSTIGYHRKHVVLYNINHFWQPLIDTLKHLQAQGFIRGSYTDYIKVAQTHSELIDLLENLCSP